ncbi:MAG TPA: polysaccharide deacetylase family protein [Bauldia sp.]|nr:polysaccharide deacetylase family protein [Bauldia sp.]
MCLDCLASPGLTRRAFVRGFAVSAATAAAIPAAHAAACFDAAALAGTAAERLRRRATAADAVTLPTPAAPASAITGVNAGVIRRVEPRSSEKPVALTFDLCQTRGGIAGYDGAIVDYLRAERVPATFFAGGLWLATHRERAVELAADPLFRLGNHSWSHHDLHSAAAATIAKEILLTESALASIRAAAAERCGLRVAHAPRLFRFPYGSCAPAAAAAANAVGSVVIQWDTVSGDPDGTPAATITRSVLGKARPGSIIVMHANGRGTHTAAALASIVPKLRSEGYRFVTVDALLAAGTPTAAKDCFIEREGDTARYDRPVAVRAPTLFRKLAVKRG